MFDKRQAIRNSLSALVMTAGFCPAFAGVINVDFNAVGSPNYSGPSASPDDPDNTYWNSFELGPHTSNAGCANVLRTTSAPLMESDGLTATDVTVSILGGVVHDNGALLPFASELFRDYLFFHNPENPFGCPGDPVDFAISNLVPGGLYDVYFYAGGGSWVGYGSEITLEGKTLVTEYKRLPESFVEGENYVAFRKVVATAGTIRGTFSAAAISSPAGNPEGEGDINGLTIVRVSSSMFRRGDADGNGDLNLTDPIAVLGHLFTSGPAPTCLDAADADDNGAVQITDAISTLGHLFLGGPALPEPFAACGSDGTADDLGCESFPACP